MVDFVSKWQVETKVSEKELCSMIGITIQRFIAWKKRYGKDNHHSRSAIPHKNWVPAFMQKRIIDFYTEHIEDGYKRCAYMMLDQDIAYVSPSTVYNILKDANALRKKSSRRGSSRKGQGFNQPDGPHKHWHIDFTYIHVGASMCFLVSVIDGWSRCILSSYLSPKMTAEDAQIAVEMARELYPNVHPRIISDNGRQFTGKEFNSLLAIHGFTHTCTAPYYPESNGKIERWHQSLKKECVRIKAFRDLEHAAKVIAAYVDHYNLVRLHSAIGYVTPMDMLMGKRDAIIASRKAKLAKARAMRETA